MAFHRRRRPQDEEKPSFPENMNNPAAPLISPEEMLQRIQDLFTELGLTGQNLTLTHAGQKYLAGCTGWAFTVYRLTTQCHLPPGHPGWPVCVVTDEAVMDESSAPNISEDEFTSGLNLEDWLVLIAHCYRRP